MGGSLNCVEEEKYIFHLILLGEPCVGSQSLGLSTGRVGSVLDPTRTRPANIKWRGEGTRNRPLEKSVGSISGDG